MVRGQWASLARMLSLSHVPKHPKLKRLHKIGRSDNVLVRLRERCVCVCIHAYVHVYIS